MQAIQDARLNARKFFIRTNLKLMSPLHTVHTERVKYIDYGIPTISAYMYVFLLFFWSVKGRGSPTESSINRQLWRRRNYNDLLASFSRDRGYKSSKVTAIAGTNPS